MSEDRQESGAASSLGTGRASLCAFQVYLVLVTPRGQTCRGGGVGG